MSRANQMATRLYLPSWWRCAAWVVRCQRAVEELRGCVAHKLSSARCAQRPTTSRAPPSHILCCRVCRFDAICFHRFRRKSIQKCVSVTRGSWAKDTALSAHRIARKDLSKATKRERESIPCPVDPAKDERSACLHSRKRSGAAPSPSTRPSTKILSSHQSPLCCTRAQTGSPRTSLSLKAQRPNMSTLTPCTNHSKHRDQRQ